MDVWFLSLTLCLFITFSHFKFGNLVTNVGLPKVLFLLSLKFYILNSYWFPLDRSLP